MAKGNIAKDNVAKRIMECFGQDYIGSENNKYYVWSKENGEKIQIAIALTCPKVGISVVNTAALDFGSNELDFNAMSDKSNEVVVAAEPSNEITQEEKDNIKNLIANLF